MALAQLECQDCHTKLEGSVGALAAPPPEATQRVNEAARYGALAGLTPEQLAFVETFIRARGIIKTVESMLGISYPTVRNRLDEVIAAMGLSPADEPPSPEARRNQRDIVAELAEGRISPDEAHRLLREQAQGKRSEPEGN
ncbi:MAG: DUF2089 domain-containing protein [Ktedonobacterales bacterium]|nr:DUF2089 domain-containing protein [Ktedonobacterales bacterium]